MSQEIKVGSKWVRTADSVVYEVIYVTGISLALKNEDRLITMTHDIFFCTYTLYIEPKPPLKVEAWVAGDGDIIFCKAGIDVASGYTREPRLDYEVV